MHWRRLSKMTSGSVCIRLDPFVCQKCIERPDYCIVDSMAVSSVLGYEGLFFIFGVPIVLIFQRKIAGT